MSSISLEGWAKVQPSAIRWLTTRLSGPLARIRSPRQVNAAVIRTCVMYRIRLSWIGRRQHVDVNIRYYIDPETELPHIHRHGVAEHEVEEVLRPPVEDRAGREGARVALGIGPSSGGISAGSTCPTPSPTPSSSSPRTNVGPRR